MGEVGNKIFCKDCVYIIKPVGAMYYPHADSICLQSDVMNYVTGERGHEFCKVKNADGKCQFYRTKEGK